MTLTIDQLDLAVPSARYADLVQYLDALNEGMTRFGMTTTPRIVAFLAQVAHESADFRSVEENLNYSQEGLRRTWPARFPTESLASAYARQPQRIANRVYANRGGNGNEASGDGWTYRGRGLIQLTFRGNYAAYGRGIADETILAAPDQLLSPRHAALSACWFWHSKSLDRLADIGDEASFNQITYKINGGWNGQADRLENWAEAKAAFVGVV